LLARPTEVEERPLGLRSVAGAAEEDGAEALAGAGPPLPKRDGDGRCNDDASSSSAASATVSSSSSKLLAPRHSGAQEIPLEVAKLHGGAGAAGGQGGEASPSLSAASEEEKSGGDESVGRVAASLEEAEHADTAAEVAAGSSTILVEIVRNMAETSRIAKGARHMECLREVLKRTTLDVDYGGTHGSSALSWAAHLGIELVRCERGNNASAADGRLYLFSRSLSFSEVSFTTLS